MADSPIFDKKNVLVTGGAGFIGSFLCEHLLKDGYRVICVDNFVTSQQFNIAHLLKDSNFEFINADINLPLDLDAYPELERFSVKLQGVQQIYHLACPTSPKKFDQFRHQTLLANSVGMRNMLDLAVKYKARFLQASTSVVYGLRPDDGHLFKESEFGAFDHLTPRSCYDEGKRFAETMCVTYREVYGVDARIARIFRTYGPRLPLEDGHMMPDFVLDAIEGRDMVIYGDEHFRSSFVYVTDVVDAMMRIMELSEDPGPVNVGSDYDIKLVDIAKRIMEMTGSESKVAFKERLPFMRDLGLPDLTKIKAAGWVPMVTLEQGLKKSVEYAVAHKDILRPKF